jgi:acetyl esterase/lipase
MIRTSYKISLAIGLLATTTTMLLAQEKTEYTRTRDVIYGRKVGLAMTMDVFTPPKPNGKGVIFVVSGGWVSNPANVTSRFFDPVLKRGYTVFAVAHGSQPKFTIPEILQDMHRAVRFIRGNARKFAIDPDHLGIMGASAGGHLSLMMGTTGGPGNARAVDPIDRLSSAVQAVGAFCPPTDFLNWSKKDHDLSDRALQPPFTAAVDYHEYDRKKAMYVRIKDRDKLREIARSVSPIYHVKEGSAPALILHGDKDELVPIHQAESMLARYKELKVPARLIVREGGGHVWPTILKDVELVADWFDEHLRKQKKD